MVKRALKSPEKKANPKVAIIILNWNGKNDTIECLESLKILTYPNYEIVLVDNGSTDGSTEYFEQHYPHVTLLKNKENLGFTGGNNVGIHYALAHDADYLVLLNNDTTVDAHLIEAMLKPFKKNETTGLVGPKVVYYENPQHVWCAGGYYNPILGRAVMYGTFSKQKIFDKEEHVDWISFCVVMIKREVFEKIGNLDDDFFSSYEDLDFCLRAKKQGYSCFYTPHTVVKHKIAQDWGGLDNPLYIYYQTRNALLCMKKNRSFLGYILFFTTYLCISTPRRAYRLYQNNKTKRISYIFMGVSDFLHGFYKKGHLSEKIRIRLQQRGPSDTTVRIGINARYLQRRMSGIERYIMELLISLPKIDKERHYVFFFNKDIAVPKIPTTQNVSLHVSTFPTANRALRLFWEHIALYYELKKQNITIFHGPAFFTPLWKPKGCKYVITVHDITFKKYSEGFTLATRLYYTALFPRSLHLADVIITDSISTKNDLIESYGINSEKIQVVYLGISEEFLKKVHSVDPKKVIAKYNLPEKYFLFTGVLSPRKNLLTILDAFKAIKEKYKAYKLVIVGRPGWLYQEIFEKVTALSLNNDVLFIDYVPEHELPFFYRNATIFLFPSLYEGFGLPILEAMASGCAVITSNVSSMPEVAGDAALYVNPTKKEELIHAMKTIINNKDVQRQLQKKGFSQIKKFSWEKTARETAAVYTKLLENRGVR